MQLKLNAAASNRSVTTLGHKALDLVLVFILALVLKLAIPLSLSQTSQLP